VSREQHRGEADRTRARDQNALAGGDVAPAHRVCTDGEELEHRGLVEADAVRLVDEGRGHAEVLRHRAVPVHAQHLDGRAAIGLSLAAGDAVAAGQIRHHVHRVARLQSAGGVCLLHQPGQLMPHHARIREIGLVAREDVQVGAADADALDTQHHLAGQPLGNGTLVGDQQAGGFAEDSQHGDCSVGRSR
jgi:hypothetical protein